MISPNQSFLQHRAGKLLAALLLVAVLDLQLPAAFAQCTAFSYQGHILDNGTNFTGAGQFEFALVTNTNIQAAATANMGGIASNEFVSSCTVLNGGNGYLTAPSVTFSGGSSPAATASAILSGGSVVGITVLTPGSGYSSPPVVNIDPPPVAYATWWSNDGSSSGGSQPSAAVTVSVSNGVFTVVLGDTNLPNMAAIPSSTLATPNLQLLIWFNDGVNGFAALQPAQNLTPVPNAVYANIAGCLSGMVGSGGLSGVYSNGVTLNNASNNLTGNLAGNGSAISNLSASSISSGTLLPDFTTGFAQYSYSYYQQTNTYTATNGYIYSIINGVTYNFLQTSSWAGASNSPNGFIYFGGGNWNLNDSSGYSFVTNFADNPGNQFLEFSCNSTNVGFVLKGNSQYWALLVDGVPEVTNHFGETSGGDTYAYIYNFPDRRNRRIELYGSFVFYGLLSGTNDGTGFGTLRRRSKRAVIVGDSFMNSPGEVARYFAWRWKNVDVSCSGEGGTGYISFPGPGSTNYLGRLIDVTSVNPDYVIVTGGINDPTNNFQSAVQTYLQALTSAVPNAKIMVIGPWWPRTPLDPQIVMRDAMASNACQAVGIPFVSTLSGVPWITGQQPNIGNAAVFIQSDNTHPTEAGSWYLGNAVADAVLNVFPNFDTPKGN